MYSILKSSKTGRWESKRRLRRLERIEIFNLTGRVSVVTGAMGGIGRPIALGLASFGSNVVLADKVKVGFSEMVEEIESSGREALILQVDVTDIEDINKMMKEILSRFGRIDVLVNNAGCNIRKPALQVSEEDWDEIMDINVKGFFLFPGGG